MMRFPNMLYQIMPNRQNRMRLQISKCHGFDGDCGYCRKPLLRLDSLQRYTCRHRIHHAVLWIIFWKMELVKTVLCFVLSVMLKEVKLLPICKLFTACVLSFMQLI